MRIAGVEAFPVALPFREPYIAANGTIEQREMVVLRITSEDGTAGHGDAVPMSLRGGPGLERILDELEGECAGALAGRELDDASDVRRLVGECGGAGLSSSASAAVDVALIDLLGRATGIPAWRILGASAAGPVACNGTLGGGQPRAVAAAARELARAGFRTLKVKVGTGEDRERLLAVREAVGPDVALRVDANGAWCLSRAQRELTELNREVGLELAEQPCESLEELSGLRASADVPIVADESVATAADAERALTLDACDAVTLKLAKVGGPHAALAVARRIPAYISSALDSAIGIAAGLHTALALPASGFAAGLAHGLATSALFADDVATGVPIGGPAPDPGSSPGLGVEVDPAALERLAI
ncbi:MAG: mandelate racemase/muconate lactonizing enzyme family protein [Solirubrobacterales bacterium]|nr:mandelate racemase/muconate lactonizing enzyme family protein [Solirubrobacterales bacterium]